MDLLCDPQTSGGMLFAVPREEAQPMLDKMREMGIETRAAIIGEVLPFDKYYIIME